MQKIGKQIFRLYSFTVCESLSLAGASWVALLALRGYSIVQIGVLEAIFHAVSICGEIPSGVVADVLGRKKTLVASRVVALLSTVAMIMSNSFITIAVAIGCSALSYNLASGSREALAYDSLKEAGRESEYDRFASTEMMLYRIGTAISTLLAGVAISLGYKKAYGVDALICVGGIVVALILVDVSYYHKEDKHKSIREQFLDCILSSARFLKANPKALLLILVNSVVGAIATLLLFFLQAKLPRLGLPTAMLGPALFLMSMGAALGARIVQYFSKFKFSIVILVSCLGIAIAIMSLILGNPYLVVVGGFIAAFSDDFLEVRTDIVLNNMIPEKQRATLISVCSLAFSIVMIILSPILGYILEMI